MRRLLISAIAAAAFALSAAPALAVVVPPHNHFLITGSGGKVHVGPYVCDHPNIYDGWLNFHLNVHVGVPGTQAFANESNPVIITKEDCPPT